MLSSIFVALLQAAAGDPAVAPPEAAPAQTTETAPAVAPAEPRYERRRVCRTYPPATGSRFPTRDCRMENVRVEEPAAPAQNDANVGQGGGEAGAAPAPESPSPQ